jgi:hypothetical protein
MLPGILVRSYASTFIAIKRLPWGALPPPRWGSFPVSVVVPVGPRRDATVPATAEQESGCGWVADGAATCRVLHSESLENQGLQGFGTISHSRGQGFNSPRLHFAFSHRWLDG